MNYLKIIMSRGRSKLITTNQLLNDFILLVPESQKKEYSIVNGDKHYIPDSIVGISSIRNYILKTFTEDNIIMLDDDCTGVWCVTRRSGYKITDPDRIENILKNTVIASRDYGFKCFGYNQFWDVRKFQSSQPIKLYGWIGGVVGVTSRDYNWDENLKCKCDIDFCLQILKKERVLFIDNRFSWIQKRDKNKGGNYHLKTSGQIEKDIEYLERKWKMILKFKKYKNQFKPILSLKRRQTLEI